jgi:hypothetical protein
MPLPSSVLSSNSVTSPLLLQGMTMGSDAIEAKTTKNDNLFLPQWDLAQILDRPAEPEPYRIFPVPEPYSEPNKLKKLAENGIPLAPNLSLRIIPINPGDPNPQAGRPIEERDPRYVSRVKTGLGLHLRW